MTAILPSAVSSETTMADLLVKYLEALSVDYVFGIPGGAIEPLYNALARSEKRDSVRSIVARHESGAAFMAEGYATSSGRLGVCCSTTGPGATNLITGVASAYANQIPMLVITPQTSLSNLGRGAFQESSCTGINTIAMFEHCTRYNTFVSHIDQFERKLVTALMTAFSDPQGPVHLSIPVDLMRAEVNGSHPSFDIVKLLNKPQLADREAILECADLFSNSKKLVFVIGEGASESIEKVLTVAAKVKAKILTIPNGKGLISPYHPDYYGVVGFAGHESARDILIDPELDSVVCIGTKMGEWASNGWDAEVILNSRLVHIDELESNFTFTPMAKLHVRGRILTVFEQLAEHFGVADKSNNAAQKTVQNTIKFRPSTRQFKLADEKSYNDESTPIKPQRLMRELPRVFPPNTRYLADIGASFAWAIHYLHPYDRRIMGLRSSDAALFRTCLEFSSMGWAIGSAIGAAFANKNQPIVCITGDGSLLMNGQEITVAVQEKLPVVFLVLNDSALGMVKHGQRLADAESIGTELPKVDFAAFARSMGANAITIQSPEDLRQVNCSEILKQQRPTLLDVHIDPEEVPPIQMRIKALKT